MRFDWQAHEGGWICRLPSNVAIVAMPERYARGVTPRPARGTKWLAQASHWCERTSTLSRYGRDEYGNKQDSAAEARKLAEDIYLEATR